MTANKTITQLMEEMDDRELMTQCTLGLYRFAQELESTQGADAKERIMRLRDLIHEITDFWDLNESLSEALD